MEVAYCKRRIPGMCLDVIGSEDGLRLALPVTCETSVPDETLRTRRNEDNSWQTLELMDCIRDLMQQYMKGGKNAKSIHHSGAEKA